jgi:transcriptional antiterminator NusG
MQSACDFEKWYALFVMTGKEEKVRERLKYRLQDKKIKIVIPKRKIRERKNGIWEIRIKKLFPGYILLNGIIGVEEYYFLKGVPDILKLLRDGYEPLEINRQEINIISRLVCDNEVIGISKVLMENDRIIVIDGPLLGMDGLIEKIDKRKQRVKVRLQFLGEPRLVDLCISMVQQAE